MIHDLMQMNVMSSTYLFTYAKILNIIFEKDEIDQF